MSCKLHNSIICLWIISGIIAVFSGYGQCAGFRDNIYPVGKLKPIDSLPKLKVGDPAPDFTLPAVTGGKISLSQYQGKKNVVISFVPAAWTPVCSDQWPGYNISKELFDNNNAVLIGITVDNIPTLYAWTKQMVPPNESLWFPVLSDFYPHGAVVSKYGVLRSDGVSERALFVIDKKGIIRYIDVHDINLRPPLEELIKALEEVNK
ncbi:MAG: peroxiredoxin [Thermodesulfobacteriota bacterium]|jgi:peroxiredoxin (alkyl hydroperoxide reductase subunit C)